jgi:hypothetical protein
LPQALESMKSVTPISFPETTFEVSVKISKTCFPKHQLVCMLSSFVKTLVVKRQTEHLSFVVFTSKLAVFQRRKLHFSRLDSYSCKVLLVPIAIKEILYFSVGVTENLNRCFNTETDVLEVDKNEMQCMNWTILDFNKN